MKILIDTILNQHIQELNDMNIFPIPDKDTGSNLSTTLKSLHDIEFTNFYEYLKALSTRLIFDAYGTSGNILAIYILGLYKYYSENLTEMCRKAASFARSTMYMPSEGAIFTAMEAVPESYADPRDFVIQYYENTKKVYEEGYLQIPELAEKNQRDAGTLGFLYILEALKDLLCNIYTV